MFNVKKIRKLTTKSRIKIVETLIKRRAEKGIDSMTILTNHPTSDIHIDENVIKSLKSKGFKVENKSFTIDISWEE